MGGPKGGNGGPNVDQDQTASNSNTTTQTAQSEAENKQTNKNTPFSFLSFGSNNNGGFNPCDCLGGGGVTQSNWADVHSSASNNNGTGQSNNQSQKGSAS
jgi:hypothetical protein